MQIYQAELEDLLSFLSKSLFPKEDFELLVAFAGSSLAGRKVTFQLIGLIFFFFCLMNVITLYRLYHNAF